MPSGALPRPLTTKQQRFVEEYVTDLNAAAAARRAGYSDKTANIVGAQNLTKLNIKAAIEKQLEGRSKRTEVTRERVLQGLLHEAQRQGEGASHGARVTAWTQLGKHLAMFTDRHEHSGDLGPRTINIVPLTGEQPADDRDRPQDPALGVPARNGSAPV